MAAKTLPRTVRNAVRAVTCLLWAVVPVAALAWDVRSLVLMLGLAAVSTGAVGFLYLAEKFDALASLHRERTHERQLALIAVIEQISCGAATDPEGKRVPTGLRAVS